jgi:tetratricopeptide (TPR) repeat protein
VWADNLVLWQDVLKKSPNKARPQNSVGIIYMRKFKIEQALPYLVRAVEIEPSTPKYWIALNSAVSLVDKYKGRCSSGEEYQAAVDRVKPEEKTNWNALSYNNLGLAYEYLGNVYLAQENYKKAVATNPALDSAWYNLALAAARRNDTSNAASAIKELKAINLLAGQDAEEAIREQQRSVQLIPK